jgi:hypothetical protein
MATPVVKTTYALDLDTVRALDELARRWDVSKSEALRRAIRASATLSPAPAPPEPLRALDRLQKALRLAPQDAARWSASVRAERRAASQRRERRAR